MDDKIMQMNYLLAEKDPQQRLSRYGWSKFKWAVGIMLISICICCHLFSDIAMANQLNNDELIGKACQLIEEEDATFLDLQRGASLLIKNQDKFPDDIRVPICLARAYYRMGDPDKDIDQLFAYYEKVGIYAKRVLEMDESRAEGHYWHALFLLKKAQKIGGLQALFIVKDGIGELETVRKIMPQYDHAGASRVLGALHCRAPSWTPFGDIDKCVALAEESIRLAPDHEENRLYLAEAYKKRGDDQNHRAQNKTLISQNPLLPACENNDVLREVVSELGSVCQPSDDFEKILHN